MVKLFNVKLKSVPAVSFFIVPATVTSPAVMFIAVPEFSILLADILPPLVLIVIVPARFWIFPVSTSASGLTTVKSAPLPGVPTIIVVDSLSPVAVIPPTSIPVDAFIALVPPSVNAPPTVNCPTSMSRSTVLLIAPSTDNLSVPSMENSAFAVILPSIETNEIASPPPVVSPIYNPVSNTNEPPIEISPSLRTLNRSLTPDVK